MASTSVAGAMRAAGTGGGGAVAATAAAGECPVCCDKYTHQQRKRVTCAYCDTECCSGCLQTYLLTLQSDAQCMGCRRHMNGEVLATYLPKTWLLSKYKEHREKVLLDREMALLPASQEMLVNYRTGQTLQDELAELDAQRRALQQQAMEVAREMARRRARVARLQDTNFTQDTAAAEAGESSRAARRQFVRACPVDTCRGFLSTAWRCGTCETWVCKDCGEPKLEGRDDAEHVCDPDTAASHALLQRDSRPCPQCAAMIFKIDGCDQMWCTQCNVAFSWRTGAVVTNGVIHNPHYYEWLRRTRGEVPRNPGDVPCGAGGGLPTAYDLDAMLRRARGVPADVVRQLRDVHRELRHVLHVDLPRMRQEANGGGDFQRNADLRLKYLLNQIDENDWRRKLQQREKRRERAFAAMQVYDMFTAAATDTYRALVGGDHTSQTALGELRQLQRFANESLEAIARRFNMTVKRLRGAP